MHVKLRPIPSLNCQLTPCKQAQKRYTRYRWKLAPMTIQKLLTSILKSENTYSWRIKGLNKPLCME